MISIVTGTLNRVDLLPNFLENTIYSDERLELVLVDGGSEDGTQDYIKSLNHKRIKLIEVGHRSCYAHYMNLGINNASHEIIAQWNDDVLLDASWDEVINCIDDDHAMYRFKWREPETTETIMYSYCINFGLYKKEVYRTAGLYNTSLYYYAGDSEMYMRAKIFGHKTKECPNIIVNELLVDKNAIRIGDEQQQYYDIIKKYKETRELPVGVKLL